MALFAGTAIARFSRMKSRRAHEQMVEPPETRPLLEQSPYEIADGLECRNDDDLAILIDIRQAVSEATAEHLEKRTVVLNLSFDRSRRSSRHYDYSHLETAAKDASYLLKPYTLESDLYLPDMSTSWSTSRKGSLALSDYDLSDGRSFSEESESSTSDDCDLIPAETSSTAYSQYSTGQSDIKDKPNFSYRLQGASVTQYSHYNHDHTTQNGVMEGSDTNLIFLERTDPPEDNDTRNVHDPWYTMPEASSKSLLTQDISSVPRSIVHISQAYSDNVDTDVIEHDLEQNKTAASSLSILPMPLIKPPSRFRYGSLIPTRPSDSLEQPSLDIPSCSRQSTTKQDNLHDVILNESHSQPTHRLPRPRRFFRNKTRPRSTPRSNSRTIADTIPPVCTLSDRIHEKPEPGPVSPLTPRCSLSDSYFPTLRDITPEVSETLHPSELQSQSRSSKPFFAGLSFGLPASKGGIRLASMEKMGERQKILLEKRSTVSERCMHS